MNYAVRTKQHSHLDFFLFHIIFSNFDLNLNSKPIHYKKIVIH